MVVYAYVVMACGSQLKVRFKHSLQSISRSHFAIFFHIVAQKTGFSSFRGPIITYSIVWIVSLILSLATGTNLFVILIPMFFAMIFAIALRVHIARKENITEFNGCLGECCCGFWCWYCSVAQSKLLSCALSVTCISSVY